MEYTTLAYGINDWKQRIAQRSDFTTGVVHLTRDNATHKAIDVLLKILDERTLIGSTTASGFIVGQRPAVCLQDAPLYSLAQNIYTEQVYRKNNSKAKIRYTGLGLHFLKATVFSKGGRPVIYDKTAAAKNYLPADQWWRIVNFDLSDESCVIDWSHEREWRVPDQLTFELSDVAILLPSPAAYGAFVKICLASGKENILTDVRGIVQLGAVFY